jgi:hypothetical protein
LTSFVANCHCIIEKAELKSGPLFRPAAQFAQQKLANRAMTALAMYCLIQNYMEQLPALFFLEVDRGTEVVSDASKRVRVFSR